MARSLILVVILASGVCAPPDPLTATVETSATQAVKVGGPAQLVVKVTNTGPVIPHLGLVFRTADVWFLRHEVTDLGGCSIVPDAAAIECGDLARGETKTYSMRGVATTAGTFHYELALREMIRPFEYVNDHPDGADVQVWDETVLS